MENDAKLPQVEQQKHERFFVSIESMESVKERIEKLCDKISGNERPKCGDPEAKRDKSLKSVLDNIPDEISKLCTDMHNELSQIEDSLFKQQSK